jgi:hypothetical protein
MEQGCLEDAISFEESKRNCPEGSEDAALDLCIQPMGEGSPFYCGEER